MYTQAGPISTKKGTMIYAVRVAVSKTIPEQHKSFAWELIEVYDKILREHGVQLVEWTILDQGEIFVIAGLVPGDYAPEALSAKEVLQIAMHEAIDKTRAREKREEG